MKLISHRGNITGPNPLLENSIDYIENAISEGFEVEIDLWHKEHNYYLGHDEPQYHVPMSWLVKHKDVLWIHCKNRESLEKMSSSVIEFHYFWHQEDDYTLTSHNIIWTYPGKDHLEKSIIVMPEWTLDKKYLKSLKSCQCYGVCSDYVGEIN